MTDIMMVTMGVCATIVAYYIQIKLHTSHIIDSMLEAAPSRRPSAWSVCLKEADCHDKVICAFAHHNWHVGLSGDWSTSGNWFVFKVDGMLYLDGCPDRNAHYIIIPK